ncbi:MAG: hypothetical protein C0610_16625 [Desulfobacteraceae bacterium]|nr:MAG: hypothetical protein C0610_16625 [Desulfobacteraceae bacterium]
MFNVYEYRNDTEALQAAVDRIAELEAENVRLREWLSNLTEVDETHGYSRLTLSPTMIIKESKALLENTQ